MLQIKKYLEKNKNPSEYNYLVKIGERLSGEKTKGGTVSCHHRWLSWWSVFVRLTVRVTSGLWRAVCPLQARLRWRRMPRFWRSSRLTAPAPRRGRRSTRVSVVGARWGSGGLFCLKSRLEGHSCGPWAGSWAWSPVRALPGPGPASLSQGKGSELSVKQLVSREGSAGKPGSVGHCQSL